VAHGMPWPQNFLLAQEVETILRNQGVEPATIGTYGSLVLDWFAVAG
jgi:pseudouridine-5'-phosphate glycosidase